jgi:hypothetical protein
MSRSHPIPLATLGTFPVEGKDGAQSPPFQRAQYERMIVFFAGGKRFA